MKTPPPTTTTGNWAKNKDLVISLVSFVFPNWLLDSSSTNRRVNSMGWCKGINIRANQRFLMIQNITSRIKHMKINKISVTRLGFGNT